MGNLNRIFLFHTRECILTNQFSSRISPNLIIREQDRIKEKPYFNRILTLEWGIGLGKLCLILIGSPSFHDEISEPFF